MQENMCDGNRQSHLYFDVVLMKAREKMSALMCVCDIEK